MKTPSYHKDLINDLKDIKFALEYLESCFEGGDEDSFLLALRHVAEAQGGFSKLARKAKLSREQLFRKNAVGSSFDDFLKQEGNYESSNAIAIKRILAWKIQHAMKKKQLKKAEMEKHSKAR